MVTGPKPSADVSASAQQGKGLFVAEIIVTGRTALCRGIGAQVPLSTLRASVDRPIIGDAPG